MSESWDLVVIGGGSGGLTAAGAARRLGARVLLVDKERLGGDCLWTGCVPSKTLLRTARLAWEMRHAARWGLPAATGELDAQAVFARVQKVQDGIAAHDSPEALAAQGVSVRLGSARFVSPEVLELDGEPVRARAFVLATGSRPALPRVDGLVEAGPLTSDSVWGLKTLPRALIVLGAGAVGLELGQALFRLAGPGARVTVLEAADRVLAAEEPELAAALRLALESQGLAIHTATTVERVRREGGEVVVEARHGGAPLVVRGDALLVATGRQPNVEALGLEAAGVEVAAHGVVVDDELRTTNPRVFAVGDVAGRLLLTNAAGLEAVVAVRNALLPLATRVDESAVPRAVFTDPELARVGLGEAAARATGREVEVLRARYGDTDRGRTDGAEEGEAKLVVAGGRLVGAHVLGAHASEVVHAAVLAVRERMPVRKLATMSWIYPSLSEVLRKAAQARYAEVLARRSTRRALSVLRRLKG